LSGKVAIGTNTVDSTNELVVLGGQTLTSSNGSFNYQLSTDNTNGHFSLINGAGTSAPLQSNENALNAAITLTSSGVTFAGSQTGISGGGINANTVANAALATMAANTVKANATGSTATPTDALANTVLSIPRIGLDANAAAINASTGSYTGQLGVSIDGNIRIWNGSNWTTTPIIFGQPPYLGLTANTLVGVAGGTNTQSVTVSTGLTLSGSTLSVTSGTYAGQTPSINTIATGTVYNLTNSYAAITFGTTSPTATLPSTGKWMVFANIQTAYAGATFAGLQNESFKIRRTNNTAADLTDSIRSQDLAVVTTLTEAGPSVMIGPIYYNGTSGDVLSVFGTVSAAPSVGNMTVTDCSITLMPAF
jgi:hypothetical protein